MKTNAAIVDLTGRKWNPFESKELSGHVTYTEDTGEIHVPYSNDPIATTIQAHELAHIRYTSKVWPDAARALDQLTRMAGTTRAIVGYAEDMRITALAGRLGIKTLPSLSDPEDREIIKRWKESFIAGGIPEARVKRLVKFMLDEHTSVLKEIGISLDSLHTKAAAERYIKHCATFIHNLLSKGEDSSKESDKEDKGKKGKKGTDKAKGEKGGDPTPGDPSEEEEEEDTTPEGVEKDEKEEKEEKDDSPDSGEGDAGDGDAPEGDAPSKGTPKGSDSKTLDTEGEINLTSKDLPDIRKAMVASVPAPPDTEKLIQDFQHVLDTADWVEVPTIERVPLTRRVAIAKNRGRKLGEIGTVLGSAYDAVAPNERRPFVAKRKSGAGGLTVLIDVSGSMTISDAQLEQLLTAHPQGVVVTYSTGDYGPYNRPVVRIIASHGRVAAPKDFRDRSATMNACDGPVLEWLAKQSGERVWVCDGYITQRNDRHVSFEHESMDAWLKAHRITRHGSLAAYLSSLTSPR